jgi:hypothetical protein
VHQLQVVIVQAIDMERASLFLLKSLDKINFQFQGLRNWLIGKKSYLSRVRQQCQVYLKHEACYLPIWHTLILGISYCRNKQLREKSLVHSTIHLSKMEIDWYSWNCISRYYLLRQSLASRKCSPFSISSFVTVGWSSIAGGWNILYVNVVENK